MRDREPRAPSADPGGTPRCTPWGHAPLRVLGGLCGFVLACASGPAPDATSTTHHEAADASPLIDHVRQLSFAGQRSSRATYSKDALQLVFQSQRDADSPFDQIYRLDLEDGGLASVAEGYEHARDGSIHPAGGRILFASTGPGAAATPAGSTPTPEAEDFDPGFDLYVATPGAPDAAPRALAPAPGYDAEAAYSPDGRSVVFASNRHAAARRATANAGDAVDLYVMDAEGRRPVRLTDTPGYDAEPRFSPDGRRIAWRRPTGGDRDVTEIFSMTSEGGDTVQLTRLGGRSTSPFHHPSGDYLIFAHSPGDADDTDLYVIDVEAGHAPVRVTVAPGFDGEPAFSPSGDEVVWTSARSPDGHRQLFVARWDDPAARSRLGLPAQGAPEAAPLLPLPNQLDPAIQQAELRSHVEALASDVTEGRLAGTPGERIAAGYVARVFRRIGLEPAGDDDSYYEAFGFTAGVTLGAGNRLVVERTDAAVTAGAGAEAPPAPRDWAVDRDWRPLAFSRRGEVAPSEVVYAGYGIVAPASDDQRAVDAYAGLDVEGRWVLVFRTLPSGLPDAPRRHLDHYASLRYKAMLARERGAVGLLVVAGPTSKLREPIAPLRYDGYAGDAGIAVVSISDALGDALLTPGGRTLSALQADADASSAHPGLTLPGVRVAATVALDAQRRTGRNVLGRLLVGDQPTRRFVVVGAHLDHLGHGEGGDSLAQGDEAGAVHPGADDNASGVAALLEAAHALIDAQRRGRVAMRHDVLLAAWSGEELGLLGSNHFVASAVDPHDAQAALSDRVLAYVNLDMVGRMRESLSLFGVESSSIWPREIERANVPIGLTISPQAESLLPTDATSFFVAGVPVLSAFTGVHGEYHTPRDVPALLEYGKLADITRLITRIVEGVASRSEPPDFVASQSERQHATPGRVRVFLGTIPDYAQSGGPGLRLSGVSEGGPAARAGLRAGDRVVEVDGREVGNLYDYTYALDALEVDRPTSIVVLRGDARLEFEVTPLSRD